MRLGFSSLGTCVFVLRFREYSQGFQGAEAIRACWFRNGLLPNSSAPIFLIELQETKLKQSNPHKPLHNRSVHVFFSFQWILQYWGITCMYPNTWRAMGTQ